MVNIAHPLLSHFPRIAFGIRVLFKMQDGSINLMAPCEPSGKCRTNRSGSRMLLNSPWLCRSGSAAVVRGVCPNDFVVGGWRWANSDGTGTERTRAAGEDVGMGLSSVLCCSSKRRFRARGLIRSDHQTPLSSFIMHAPTSSSCRCSSAPSISAASACKEKAVHSVSTVRIR